MAAAITDAGRGVPVGSASAHIALARASSALTDADEGAAGSLADRVGQDGTENPPATAKATDNRVAASLDRSCQTGASRPRSANAATADPASNGNAISRAATASPGPAADGTPIIRQCQALPRPPPRAAWAQATTSAGKSGNVRISGCSLSANCASAACIARADIVGPGTQPDTPHEDETAHPRRGDRDELAPQCRLGHAAGTHAADRYGVLRER